MKDINSFHFTPQTIKTSNKRIHIEESGACKVWNHCIYDGENTSGIHCAVVLCVLMANIIKYCKIIMINNKTLL